MNGQIQRMACWGIVFVALCAFTNALNVSLEANAFWQNTSTINLTFAVQGNATACTLYTNESNWSGKINVSSINASNTIVHVFEQGQWTWNVECSDGNASVFASLNATVKVDTAPAQNGLLSVNGYNVSWTLANDSLSGVNRYELYRNNSLVFNSSNQTTFNDSTAALGAQYVYDLNVFDAAGNLNASQVTFQPLLLLSNVSFRQKGPREFNVTWETPYTANSSIAGFPVNGSNFSQSNPEYKKVHSFQFIVAEFKDVTATVSSCSRACVSASVFIPVPPTVNQSFGFSNVSFNNQTAVFSGHWQSVHGLNEIIVYSNNSGQFKEEYKTYLTGEYAFDVNFSFVTNNSASRVIWYARAVDVKGDTFYMPNYTLYLNPAPAELNDSFIQNYSTLRVGQTLIIHSGLKLSLIDISRTPTGTDQRLYGLFELKDANNSVLDELFIKEQSTVFRFNTTIKLFDIFLGLENSSYVHVWVNYSLPALNTVVQTNNTSNETATPTSNANNTNQTKNETSQEAQTKGKILSTKIIQPTAQENVNASTISGYLLSAEYVSDTVFHVMYENQGENETIRLVVRIKDEANRTVKVIQTDAVLPNATTEFTTKPTTLKSGKYVAEFRIVTEKKGEVIDQKIESFIVNDANPDFTFGLITTIGLLVASLFVMAARVTKYRHKLKT